MKPPFVTRGDTMSSSTFWHGAKMDEWANAWTRYFTGGKGNYMIAAMEDTGTLQSLTLLANAGRVDLRRVLVLRTVSNFDRQPPGTSAVDNLKSMVAGSYSAYMPALEAAQIVGDKVVRYLVDHWKEVRWWDDSVVCRGQRAVSAGFAAILAAQNDGQSDGRRRTAWPHTLTDKGQSHRRLLEVAGFHYGESRRIDIPAECGVNLFRGQRVDPGIQLLVPFHGPIVLLVRQNGARQRGFLRSRHHSLTRDKPSSRSQLLPR